MGRRSDTEPAPAATVELLVYFVGDVEGVERGGVRGAAQCGGGVSVAEPGLGLEELAVSDQVGGDAVPEPVQRRVRQAGTLSEPGEPVGQQICSGVGEPPEVGVNTQSPCTASDPARRSHASKCVRIISAVVPPIVMRRVRPVLVGPSTSRDRFRSMVNTRSSRSLSRRVASSPPGGGVRGKPDQ